MAEMMELYPDAKVVLVKRDAVKWWNSIAALTSRTTPVWLGPLMAPIPGWRHLPSFANEYSRSMLSLIGLTEDTASPVELLKKGGPRKLFFLVSVPPSLEYAADCETGEITDILEAHCDKVRALVPKGQLLEMEVSEGWEPLCRFLGVPVPDEPFPRANDAVAADRYATGVILKSFGVWSGILAVTGSLLYSGLWLWNNRAY